MSWILQVWKVFEHVLPYRGEEKRGSSWREYKLKTVLEGSDVTEYLYKTSPWRGGDDDAREIHCRSNVLDGG